MKISFALISKYKIILKNDHLEHYWTQQTLLETD